MPRSMSRERINAARRLRLQAAAEALTAVGVLSEAEVAPFRRRLEEEITGGRQRAVPPVDEALAHRAAPSSRSASRTWRPTPRSRRFPRPSTSPLEKIPANRSQSPASSSYTGRAKRAGRCLRRSSPSGGSDCARSTPGARGHSSAGAGRRGARWLSLSRSCQAAPRAMAGFESPPPSSTQTVWCCAGTSTLPAHRSDPPATRF